MVIRFVGEPDDGITVSSHHARALAEADVEVWFDESGAPRNDRPDPDLIHLVTYEQQSHALLRDLLSARMAGVPIVRYWTGRDALWARFHRPSREFAQAVTQLEAVQFTRTATLANDLARIGVAASPLPVLSLNLTSTMEPEPFPAVFTVLCYLPSARREFHGGSCVDSLIAQLPTVRFLILGDAATDYSARKNVESLGVVEDVSRAIKRSTVIVTPRVDASLSRLALEALCHGRHVVTTCSLPHCHAAGTVDEFLDAIRGLQRQTEFNLAGREQVCRMCDKPLALRALRAAIEPCVVGGSFERKMRGGWSGAVTALCNPGILTRTRFDLPDPGELPPEAAALRTLLPLAGETVVGAGV